jgi:hypothetical protein
VLVELELVVLDVAVGVTVELQKVGWIGWVGWEQRVG